MSRVVSTELRLDYFIVWKSSSLKTKARIILWLDVDFRSLSISYPSSRGRDREKMKTLQPSDDVELDVECANPMSLYREILRKMDRLTIQLRPSATETPLEVCNFARVTRRHPQHRPLDCVGTQMLVPLYVNLPSSLTRRLPLPLLQRTQTPGPPQAVQGSGSKESISRPSSLCLRDLGTLSCQRYMHSSAFRYLFHSVC